MECFKSTKGCIYMHDGAIADMDLFDMDRMGATISRLYLELDVIAMDELIPLSTYF